MATVLKRQGRLAPSQDVQQTWRERISQAREHRKPLERTWMSNLAFAAGQHWLVWDEQQRKLRHLQEVDPRYGNVDLYTADRITEFRQAQLGELGTDDDRPELLAAQGGNSAEEIERQLNQAVAHAWEHEWDADETLAEARRLCYDLGTSAIRVRYDGTRGPVTAHVPLDSNSRPVLDNQSLDHLEEHGMLPDGTLPEYRPVKEGRSLWEPLSAFNLLTPPGVTRETRFPWEVIVRPTHVDEIEAAFGVSVDEDGDIANVIGMTTAAEGRQPGQTERGRLRDHAWLYTCFERPCINYPNGRMVWLAGNGYELLDMQEELDYQDCEGQYRTGLHYMHWWRLSDRFWSRAAIEPLKDPQRMINRRETQNIETIDRGQPKVFLEENSLVDNPTGLPLEKVYLKASANPPNFHPGVGPGAWMYEDIAHHAENLSHASTLSPLRLGENPAAVNTYSQLALLNENEALKRSDILAAHKRTIAGAVEDGVHDIRKYWPEQKQILVSGEDERIAQETYQKSQIPDLYIVKVAKGAPKPRSQGAELKKVEAIWNGAVQSGLVVNNPEWIVWFKESMDAGQCQELPRVEMESTLRLAHFENFLMQAGEQVQPSDYDPPAAHIPIHRSAQDEARASGDMETYQRIEQHLQATLQVQAVNAMKAQQAAQQASPLGPHMAPNIQQPIPPPS